MTGRKFALTRVKAGDYLCPSNDSTFLYRFQKYQDGAALGLDVNYELRDFWRVSWTPTPMGTYIDLGALDEYAWTEIAHSLPTRAAAIEWAFGGEVA